ncbi:MAG: hypothetical protein ACTSU5_14790 [Promethearchaeota archaeon]
MSARRRHYQQRRKKRRSSGKSDWLGFGLLLIFVISVIAAVAIVLLT